MISPFSADIAVIVSDIESLSRAYGISARLAMYSIERQLLNERRGKEIQTRLTEYANTSW